jgi:preprotein translocase subunit Sss1
MRLPILNDVTFVIKKVKLASDKEIERRGWVVGILILLIGVIGFIIHLIMSLF